MGVGMGWYGGALGNPKLTHQGFISVNQCGQLNVFNQLTGFTAVFFAEHNNGSPFWVKINLRPHTKSIYRVLNENIRLTRVKQNTRNTVTFRRRLFKLTSDYICWIPGYLRFIIVRGRINYRRPL
jgi:hypothetical protein